MTRFGTDHGEFFFNMQDDGPGLPTCIVYNRATGEAVGRLKVEPL